jgi:DNA repair protein RadC
LDQVVVHPREVFRAAIVACAHSVVIVHNHPSGDPNPSDADIRITKELIAGGKLLRVDVRDHIIIGSERNVSLRELGYSF